MVGTEYTSVGYYRQEYYFTTRTSTNQAVSSQSDGDMAEISGNVYADNSEYWRDKYKIAGMYSSYSTDDDPIVKVSVQGEDGVHIMDVHINDVNPAEATELEMYAFFYHQDQINGKALGYSYGNLMEFADNAKLNGLWDGNNSIEDFENKTSNWRSLVVNMNTAFTKSGLYSMNEIGFELDLPLTKACIKFTNFDRAEMISANNAPILSIPAYMFSSEALSTAWGKMEYQFCFDDKLGKLCSNLFSKMSALLDYNFQGGSDRELLSFAIDSANQIMDDMSIALSEKTAARSEVKAELAAEKQMLKMFIGNVQETLQENSEFGQPEDLGRGFINVGMYGMGMTASMTINENGEKIVTVEVATGSGNETYEVNLSKVDPRNATAIEMFAFCQYADAHGTGVSDKWGSWHAFKTFANPSGTSLCYNSLEEAATEKRDWTATLAKSKMVLTRESTGETMTAADVFKLIKDTLEENYSSFSEKEESDDWRDMDDDEWNRLIEKIDSYIDQYKEELARDEEIRKEASSDLLTARYSTYTRKSSYTDPDSSTGEQIRVGYMYRTFYTREGIISERSGYNSKEGSIKDRIKWKVDFNDEEDYDRTMHLLDRIPEGDNTPFVASELFWKDFVDGKIDEDELMEFYETLDHGIANFIKTDEDGKNYIDKEMMDSKYFKYFGVMQVTTFSEEELQRGLELSALKDRGFDHTKPEEDEAFNVYNALYEAFSGSGNEFRFYGEDETYDLNDWIRAIIQRSHWGLMDSLFAA